MTTGPQRASQGGGVQSLERAFDLLELMADAGGEVGLSELAADSPGCRCRPSTA